MHIAFVIDLLAFEGLGTTLTSLVRNCRDNEKLTLHFLCSDVTPKHKDNILRLLQAEDYRGATQFHDFEAKKRFGHLVSLHGNWTMYGKFLIPEMVDAEYVLYLDTDILVLIDILKLQDIRFDDHYLAAAPRGPYKNALERNLLIDKLGLDEEARCFNTGVMILNRKVWRERNIDQKIEKLCNEYPMDFRSADQAVLNAVAAGVFYHLEGRFNYVWSPEQQAPTENDNVIFHFAGSPKPWDFFGKVVHSGHALWSSYDTKFWDSTYKKLTLAKLHRTWKIRRSMIRHYMKRFRGAKAPAVAAAK